ncbi:MAG: FGGY family carbohydrate kinase [Bacteroidales bacterium]
MKQKVIAIFDIGKTNKKILLFDTSLKLVSEKEEQFPLATDEDGFECDSMELIESWIKSTVSTLARSDEFELLAVNFATYGATLVYLDSSGRRLTPVYNYLKPVDNAIPASVYEMHGGVDEFSRRTASPALGMLNSGMQALWLKKTRPDVFARVKYVLHFPQYLSYLLTGEVCSEHTSIGCHTAMWDFDNFTYHPWLASEKIPVPDPVPVTTSWVVNINGHKFRTFTGLHDSSASLAPYFSASEGKFLLVSTGTWCINMNPFNPEVLTNEQLKRDCLCYLSVTGEPVKSSRLFLGNMHDLAVKRMSQYFKIHEHSFRMIKPDLRLLNKLLVKFNDERVFLSNDGNMPHLKEEPDLFVFDNFLEGYHQLMVELTDIAVEAINLVMPEMDDIEKVYITGGFSKNPLFLKLLASSFPDKKVYISEISNATALGAAVITHKGLYPEIPADPGLVVNEVKI